MLEVSLTKWHLFMSKKFYLLLPSVKDKQFFTSTLSEILQGINFINFLGGVLGLLTI